ncbi:hypothetical protein [Terrabacter sp. MAHUQ-38]|uniref:hypothetical protein n=1 Tax=unclassified Terrabacter TaxID=2630222 RepID=UPI00165E4830|nr:hypothetical protein [Terrabacter sp. MAHUQ-38]MBC9822746.1 hypothetical protein [Terrabacter sp. MAHUQ-38]
MSANLFQWQEAIVGSKLPTQVKLTAVLLVHGGKGTSGREVTIKATTLAGLRGVSERTIWRHVEALTGTWLVQTTKPTRGYQGGKGRKARYACCVPESSVTREPERGTRLDGIVCHFEPPRLSISGESSDTAEHGNGTVLPSDGPAFDSPTNTSGLTPGAGEEATTASNRPAFEADPFDMFWKMYPRKTGKGAARGKWAKAVKAAGGDPEVILNALVLQLPALRMQLRPDGDYRPHPATWLHQERWQDELAAVPSRPRDAWERARRI